MHRRLRDDLLETMLDPFYYPGREGHVSGVRLLIRHNLHHWNISHQIICTDIFDLLNLCDLFRLCVTLVFLIRLRNHFSQSLHNPAYHSSLVRRVTVAHCICLLLNFSIAQFG